MPPAVFMYCRSGMAGIPPTWLSVPMWHVAFLDSLGRNVPVETLTHGVEPQ